MHHLRFAKTCWKQLLLPGDVAVDATCGNGHDTLFLARLPLQALFAMDIQQVAIKTAQKRLSEQGLCPVIFVQKSHEEIDKLPYPAPPKLIVYNLGYLPGSNKQLTTQLESTLLSVQRGLKCLGDGGALSITCYPNHSEGEREESALLDWARTLLCQDWEVRYHKWMNRHVKAPSLLFIQRQPAPNMLP